jgi:adenylate kinase family enzyme
MTSPRRCTRTTESARSESVSALQEGISSSSRPKKPSSGTFKRRVAHSRPAGAPARYYIHMDRVRVVGSAGSGKSTVARAMARVLDMPHLELDAVHWLPGWQERGPEEFREAVMAFASRPRWVIDGNYSGRLGDCLDHLVDTYVWLDLPRWRVTLAVLARTIRRAVTGQQLWETGNRERLSSLFNRDPLENIVLWSWTQHGRQRKRWEELEQTCPHQWIRLRSRRQVNRFVDGLGHDGRSAVA